jgi:hypothetical protein
MDRHRPVVDLARHRLALDCSPVELAANPSHLRHEFLAMMLGVRRPGVTLAARSLQEDGLITYKHGTMTVLDREGLERAACECHGVIQREFARLMHWRHLGRCEEPKVMALVLRGYSVERPEFAVFWSGRHVGTYQPHAVPKQLKLLPGVAMDVDLATIWRDALPEASVVDWRLP